MPSVRIGVDTGGTFTDVVLVDDETGQIITTKTPSTPADPAEGFMAAVHKVLEAYGGSCDIGAVAAIVHGTTVATNLLLQERPEGMSHLGFITTEGFEFILEIARQSVPDGYGNSYFWVKPPRIVPVHRVKTVGGRLDHLGREVRPFDEEEAVRVARWFKERGITAIGVCFLHSYANPEHERRMREVLAREHPEAVVSISSDVLREYREYERSVTTLVDAAVKPVIRQYIGNLTERLGRGFSVMKSNGGILSAAEVVHQPIATVLSGPAAGALGAALIAANAGHPSVITLDGGGTSTDVAVVINGEPSLTTEGSIGPYPCKIPMIDIVTVGAGGGSIAWVSPEGTLKVGPRSAGADPGPLCYAKGGTEVTVTDAHVFLGRVPPHLLGGEIALDVAAARKGLEELAGRLGLTPERCATGILEISAFNQANAIRQITVERGLDIREFPMVAFGGSGPLLACRLIDILGLPAVIVPPDPGNLSAFGLLSVDVRNDYVRTYVSRNPAPEKVAELYAELEAQAADALDREGFTEHVYARSADLRYYGQAYEVRVPAPDGPIDAAWLAAVVDRFHTEHERLYGYAYRNDPRHAVEFVNFRVSGIGPIKRPTIPRRPRQAEEPSPVATRQVYFDQWSRTVIYRRGDLGAGAVVRGPAVIEEYGSTLPVHPGFTATMDDYGNLVVVSER
ncbi:5-oxoprolinase [Thermobispora bispora]|uniref:5-oxoprolinase (ATP-hydrolyzing) n=1 Tax=Thermobispora bispora (strain ATCC 19993 / DSM 43833 / CBS 139.67 / JCM 10125 / KCTC 9307 / NBRC 14880 / R51) TaxID=469371 RepID=D6Y361_THEBD|nr:hydantoinase/oxoprolinase family protein [Thermobispora bispora]ADG88936.1 5-oxoprolinase (ATP-hydrolyzing) [Thermobispora bispora DSM 43833]MBO2474708.1 hydantoinase/oxoprolinase family protein [Actinomycetales bacterium]MBX6168747.1 hydantoinase/oxoprolinase family protein [Thermobispora bispora]